MLFDTRSHDVEALVSDTLSIDANGVLHLVGHPDNITALIEARNEAFRDDWLTLRVLFKIADPERFLLHVPFVDGRVHVICNVDGGGRIADHGCSESARCILGSDGQCELTTTFYSISDRVQFGLLQKDDASRHGTAGRIDIFRATVALDRPAQRLPDELLSYVDVGARGGRIYELKQARRQVRVTMFEPEPSAIQALLAEQRKYPGTTIIQKGLHSSDGPQRLFVTAGKPCSSVLEPNLHFLKDYPIGFSFQVERVVEIDCCRYDTLYGRGEVPRPDAVKIDVQGAEYEVLEGFGSLLQDCIGIELETHVYPVYQNQKLLSDITTFLQKFGLMLVRLEPQRNFGPDLIEFNAWFLKSPAWISSRGEKWEEKLKVLKRIWFL